MKDRIQYFDAVKLLAICLVLYGHCEQHFLSGHPYDSPIYIYIYSFHMPLFMLISGFFSHSVMKLEFWDAIKKKSRQLLLPCIIWGLAIIAIRLLLGDGLEPKTILLNDLWFLKSLFICIFLMYVYERIPSPYKYCFLVLSLLATQTSIFRLKDMYPCFVFGYFLKTKFDEVTKYKYAILAVSAIIYVTLGHIYLNNTFFQNGIGIMSFITKRASVLAIGISASVFILLTFQSLEKFLPSNICKYGKNTLEIYLVQALLLETLIPRFVCLDECFSLMNHLLVFPMIIIAVICTSILISKLAQGHKTINTLLFGK